MGQSKSSQRSRDFSQPQPRNVDLRKPSLPPQYILQLPDLSSATELDVTIKSYLVTRKDTTSKPSAPIRPATPEQVDQLRSLTDLPNEILDIIFNHLERHEHTAFLRNRATYSAAMRAIWSDINLGLSVDQMLHPRETYALRLRKGKLAECLRVGNYQNLALTRRLTFYVDQVNDWTYFLSKILEACSNLLMLDLHLYGGKTDVVKPMPIPRTVRYLTVNRPHVLRWQATESAEDKETTSPPVPQLDQLTLRLICHQWLTNVPFVEDSAWCNVRDFKFEMRCVQSRDSRSIKEQASRSLREFSIAMQYLTNDNASRASLRRVEFVPAGYITTNRPSSMSNEDSIHLATIFSLIQQLPSLEVLNIPFELLLPCLENTPPDRQITFEIPLKACDLAANYWQAKGISALFGVKAFLEMLPPHLESRRIKPVLDVDATELSDYTRFSTFRFYGANWTCWAHSRLEAMGTRLVTHYLRAVVSRRAKVFYSGPRLEIVESLSLVALWLKRMNPKVPLDKAFERDILGDAIDENMVCDFFNLVNDGFSGVGLSIYTT